MPDEEILDLREPYPNMVIDRLRRAVIEAIDGLQEQIDRINNAFLLLSVTADFSQAVANTTKTATTQMQAIGQQLAAVNTRTDAAQTSAKTAIQNADLLQTQMADVLARLAALETPTEP